MSLLLSHWYPGSGVVIVSFPGICAVSYLTLAWMMLVKLLMLINNCVYAQLDNCWGGDSRIDVC